MVRWICLVALCFSYSASADLVFVSLKWRADSRFFLAVESNGAPIIYKGYLRDDSTATVKDAVLHSYVDGFVTVTVGGAAFLLERQNAEMAAMNAEAIHGEAATLATDVDAIVADLKNANKWDPSLAFRAIVAFFREHPDKTVGDCRRAIALGTMTSVPRPQPKTAGMTIRTPALPRGAVAMSEPAVAPAVVVAEAPAAVKPKVVREEVEEPTQPKEDQDAAAALVAEKKHRAAVLAWKRKVAAKKAAAEAAKKNSGLFDFGSIFGKF